MDRRLIVLLILFCVYISYSTSNNCTINSEIRQVKANCEGKGIDFVPNDLPGTITKLCLNINKISILKNNSFSNYTKLVILNIDNNRLSVLEARAFVGLKRLRYLSMKNNQLNLVTSYHAEVFSPLSVLKKLDIRNNFVDPSKTTPENYPHFGELRDLTDLFMDLVPNPSFNTSGMKHLTGLRVLRFAKCYLRSMLNVTFVGFPGNIEEVYFEKCIISFISVVQANFLKPFHKLQVLSLDQANVEFSKALELLYPFTHKRMEAIIFRRVGTNDKKSVILTKQMMSYLQNICVKTLVLAENEIVHFEQGSLLTHTYPKCFETIVLSGNRFSLAREHMGELLRFSTQVVNLKTFDYSYNPLNYNKIEYLHNVSMFFSEPTILNVMGNHSRKDEVYINLTNEKLKPTYTFTLPYNLQTLRMTHFLSTVFDEQTVTIRNASNLQNLDLSYFQMDSFPNVNFDSQVNIKFLDFSGIDSTLYSTKSHIPLFKRIQTVILKDARLDQTMKINGQIFQLIPTVKILDISWNNLYFMDTDVFISNTKLSNLTVSNNLLSEIPIGITHVSTLKKLDIGYNRLQTINETIRSWIDRQNSKFNSKFELSLWGNVFKCTCETIDFLRWMFKSTVKFDKRHKNYICILSNGTETDTLAVYNNLHEHFSDCNSQLWLRVGIGCLIGFVVFTIPIALLINFRWKIAFWAYRKFKRVIQRGIERKFKYDIYLSYSDDSINWIQEILVPKIEDSWALTMCLRDRDFLPGGIHADSIANAIQESRHVIFVFSDVCQENEWRRFEIERTKFEKYTNDLQKIIVIAKEICVTNIPYELYQILKDVTITEWSGDNELLWDRLRMSIFSDSL